MAKRFKLPPLDLIQGFEAAARNLSFTKAAEELYITQSAVSRQIRALEDYLGIALFVRRPRSLELTEHGRVLQAAAGELLGRLQEVTDRLRADPSASQLTVTTTNGFASLWLIPRLRGFTVAHPDVDVRISATYSKLNLERSLIDVAIRYCREENAPAGGVRLFGGELFPVCSPALLEDPERPLRTLKDFAHHTLLFLDELQENRAWFDWQTWLAAHGLPDIKPAATVHFGSYDQMIQAALGGQGIAMGIAPLVQDLVRAGQLVIVGDKSKAIDHAYYIAGSSLTGGRPHVRAFIDWVVAEAQAMAAGLAKDKSRPRGAPANGAARALR